MSVTTGIGSLPHHNVDAALAYAFRWTLPFLPQIPVRHPKEYMIYQALEGIPGLTMKEKGEAAINRSEWEKGEDELTRKLEMAFRSTSPTAFKTFEPSDEAYSAWEPFLWELSERKIKRAKIQIAGPMTSQWSLRLEDGTPADKHTDIGMQIFRLVLAKSIAMVRRLKEIGVTPVIYVDEPSFYCFSKRIPKHLLGLQELKIFIQTLKKEGATVGLHCCSNTDWDAVLSLGLDILSIDTTLSFPSLVENHEALKEFFHTKGILSLGVIPTLKGKEDLQNFDPKKTMSQLREILVEHGFSDAQKILSHSIYTPACGLALHRVEDTETVLALLERCTVH
jgi:hypothetical protein